MLNVQRRFAFLFFAAAAVTGLSCGGGAGNNGTAGPSGAGASEEGGSSPMVPADAGPDGSTGAGNGGAGTPDSGGAPADAGSTDSPGGTATRPKTFVNPINIDYYFQTSGPSRKETADPAVCLYKDHYYLFASQGHGYWYSSDLLTWAHVNPDWATPVFQEWAPACWTINGALYFATPTVVYSTTDGTSGHWTFVANNFKNLGDPDYFVDDDGKLYAYYGLSNSQPPHGIQIDPVTLKPIGNEVAFFVLDPTKHGWENPGDTNEDYSDKGWLEGTWMSKHNGTYYLQYACPGTEYASYSDGVYTSKSPLGPFAYAPNNPFSTRLTGFSHSAGHSATFQDKFGNWWHIGNALIGDKDPYERRLSLYPGALTPTGSCSSTRGSVTFPSSFRRGPPILWRVPPNGCFCLIKRPRPPARPSLRPAGTRSMRRTRSTKISKRCGVQPRGTWANGWRSISAHRSLYRPFNRISPSRGRRSYLHRV